MKFGESTEFHRKSGFWGTHLLVGREFCDLALLLLRWADSYAYGQSFLWTISA
jgi:hypothetical protein